MNGRRKLGWVLGTAGAAMMIGALVVGPGMAQAEDVDGEQVEALVATLGGVQITSWNSNTWSDDCDLTEWHWWISKISPTPAIADVPPFITVTWSSGPNTQIPLDSLKPNAHYYYYGHLDDGVHPTSATAVWPTATNVTSYGKFTLSHGPCEPATTTTTTIAATTTTAVTTTTAATTTSAAPEFENLPPVPEEESESAALPQTGWVGTNATLLLGLTLLFAGLLLIGLTRRSASS